MRSAGDAEYVLVWIDRAAEAARTHGGFNAEAGRARVLAQVAEARAEFERRGVRLGAGTPVSPPRAPR